MIISSNSLVYSLLTSSISTVRYFSKVSRVILKVRSTYIYEQLAEGTDKEGVTSKEKKRAMTYKNLREMMGTDEGISLKVKGRLNLFSVVRANSNSFRTAII